MRRVSREWRVAALVLALEIGQSATTPLGQPAAVAFALLLLAVAAWLAAPVEAQARPIGPRALAGLFAIAWLIDCAHQWPHASLAEHAVLVVGMMAIIGALVKPPRFVFLVGGALALGLAVRVTGYLCQKIDPVSADMLPAVQGAVDRLLAGKDPYGMYQMPGWTVPLVYLPGTWGAYLPARALGLDVRVTNLIAELGFAAALWWAARSSELRGRALGLWAFTYLSGSPVRWSIHTEHPVGWLVLGVTAIAAVRASARTGGVLLGVAGATTPLAALLAPFVGLGWLRRVGFGRALVGALLAAAVAGAILLPFYAWDPKQFTYGVFRWHNDNTLFPGIKWQQSREWASQLGVSGLFWAQGRERWLKPIQALLVAATAIVYARRGARSDELLPYAALAATAFVAFNPVLWGYLYWPAAVLATASLLPPNAITDAALLRR